MSLHYRAIAVCAACLMLPMMASAANVREFGATGDGRTVDTAAVQSAIDSVQGGGTVEFPAGTYLCGSLHLRSRLHLVLRAGATLLGIPDRAAYDPYEELGFPNEADEETSFFHHALLWGEDIEHVTITGPGVIDANFSKRGGPKPIALKRCRYVQIEGITILNAPNYAISLLGTDFVEIDGVTIRDAYCDGIDPDSCRNVRITNCHIESWDDAIVPKASFSLGERRSTENITVANCYLATACNAFKLGTESGGDFKRIAVSNCVMDGLQGKRDAIAGIAIESVDGAHLDGVVISNITMVNVSSPIFIRLGNRGRDMEPDVPGRVRNIAIDNVVATNASLVSVIAGIPDYPVENISLSNVRVSYVGGGPYQGPEEPVNESIKGYPSPDNFGRLPGYAFYCRHASNLTFTNVDARWENGFWRVPIDEKGNWEWPHRGTVLRPAPEAPVGNAFVFDDVVDLRISELRARPSNDGDAVLRMLNTRDALVTDIFAREGETWVDVSGGGSKNIVVTGTNITPDHVHAAADARAAVTRMPAGGGR